jgi:hypothetical protein
MQRRRLLKLADFLETVPRRRFDMGFWGNGKSPKECGFAGCAAGWGTVILPSLEMVHTEWGTAFIKFKDYFGFKAIQEYFGIDRETSWYIFDSMQYPNQNYNPTPKYVAKRIRSVVYERQKIKTQEDSAARCKVGSQGKVFNRP